MKTTALCALCTGILLTCLPFRSAAEIDDPDILRRIDPILRQELLHDRSSESVRNAPAAPLVETHSGRREFVCWLHFDEGAELPEGLPLRFYGTSQASARLTLEEIDQLAHTDGVRQIEAARKMAPILSESIVEIGADIAHSSSGSPPVYAGYSGKNVVVGIVDTGTDFDHEDFGPDGDCRIQYLWDQTSVSINPPSGFGYGREWTKSDIDSNNPTQSDDDGHGTHVAGTAAGSGAATGNGEDPYQYVGVAPEADIIIVKTDFYTSSIVDGVDYIFQKAAALGKPAVVNLSLGHHYGPHDGTESTDLAIDALVGVGKVVVAAAGNDQGDPIHAETSVSNGDTESITLSVPAYTSLPGSSNDYIFIDGYYTNGETVEVTVRTPSGDTVGPVTAGNQSEVSTSDGWILVENDFFDPVTDDKNIYIQIWDKTSINAPSAGTYTIELSNATPALAPSSAQCDFWLYNHTLSSAPEFVQGMTQTKLVSSPATADSVIAVAAYVTRASWRSTDGNIYTYNPPPTVGEIASFSSNGPRRDGVRKPDIAAPGQGIGAALSSDDVVATAWILEDDEHYITQGTSMACPHVTGLVALMFDSMGSVSRSAIMDKLASTARGDAFTGSLPNNAWGYGKIDVEAATLQTTPILISALDIRRDEDGIFMSWEVPQDLASLRFRIERVASGEFEERIARPYGSQFVAEVGPGPEYAYQDSPLLDSEEVSYWLVPLLPQGGRDVALGPYVAKWESTAPDLALSRPMPNPFSTSSQWVLSLPATGQVTIDIIDPAGRRVRSLVNGEHLAGDLSVVWEGERDDGRNSPSGIYYVRATWNGRGLTEKVLLLRE